MSRPASCAPPTDTTPGLLPLLLTLLPEVLHLAAGSGHRGIDDTVRLLTAELSDPQLATPTVLNRLVDVLLIQLIRSWVSSNSREAQASCG